MPDELRLTVAEKCPNFKCKHYGSASVTKAELSEVLTADQIDYFCPYCRTFWKQKLSQKDREDFRRMIDVEFDRFAH
jgi:ribosomal protein L44E